MSTVLVNCLRGLLCTHAVHERPRPMRLRVDRGVRSSHTVGLSDGRPGESNAYTRAVRAPTAYPTKFTPKCTALITTNANRASGKDSA